MLTLHLEADSHQSLIAAACKALGIPPQAQKTDAPPAPVSTADVASSPAPALATLPAPAPHAPRRGRRPADPTSAPIASPGPTPSPAAPVAETAAPPSAPAAPAAAVSTTPPSVDDVRTALNGVNEKHGMGVCTALLTEFGAQRVSLVPEDKRVEFIAACKKKAAEAPVAPAANKPAPGA